jgi:hypothetical protein
VLVSYRTLAWPLRSAARRALPAHRAPVSHSSRPIVAARSRSLSRAARHAATRHTATLAAQARHRAAMPPKGVDDKAREAMTHKIAPRIKSMLQPGQDPVAAARQIEAKCYESAKDAQDYERKVEKRLAKAAKALEASQRPSMAEPSDTAPLEKKQALARKRSREDSEAVQEAKRPRSSDFARDLLREHGATLEWWRSSDVIGRRMRAIIDAATAAGSVGDEARTWASEKLQNVEKLEKAATSLLKQLEARSGNLSELPGYCTKLKESKADLEAHLGKLAPQWAPSSVGEAAVESWCDIATNDVAGALRARLGACVGAISQDALGAYRVECPRDSFTATIRLQTNHGRVARAWVTTVRAGERSPASSYDFWRRVGDVATEAADGCVKKAGGSTLGVVARLLVVIALARDASASTAAARHKASVARSAPRVPDFARAARLLEREGARGVAR